MVEQLDLGNVPRVIPVIEINDVARAVDLAQALIAGGLPLLEITLRSPNALACLKAIADVPNAQPAAGTVKTPDDLKAAQDAGAALAFSPGFTPALGEAARAISFPLVPGVATASEVMRAQAHGYSFQKFFPAEAAGGVATLKSFAGPLADVSFCPTGGINLDNAGAYLALKTVRCVGGSWVATKQNIEAGNWEEIQRRAEAVQNI